MDNMNFGREKDFRLGVVARSIPQEHDLFTAMGDPIAFAGQILRFPSGPAILMPKTPTVARLDNDYHDAERWDGLS